MPCWCFRCIQLTTRGYTHEQRPIVLLITSPNNHSKIDKIQADHALLASVCGTTGSSKMPLVVYQGFSIHGNEPSGSNASLLAAYHLAASTAQETTDLLENVVILFDPSFNPDGLQRFAYWANTNRSSNLNPDNNDREYREVWPGGRTNHYWFDLTIGFLVNSQKVTRIKTFTNLPNILTDHHEMGTNQPFSFSQNKVGKPLTPKIKCSPRKLYLPCRSFWWFGLALLVKKTMMILLRKGSTYPDVNGSIGILFEQASSRGHVQNSITEYCLPFTVRNQLTAALP